MYTYCLQRHTPIDRISYSSLQFLAIKLPLGRLVAKLPRFHPLWDDTALVENKYLPQVSVGAFLCAEAPRTIFPSIGTWICVHLFEPSCMKECYRGFLWERGSSFNPSLRSRSILRWIFFRNRETFQVLQLERIGNLQEKRDLTSH